MNWKQAETSSRLCANKPLWAASGPAGSHLDFLDGVDDEGVLQVLHCALHPVVERSRSFGKLKVQLVDGFEQLLSSLVSMKNTRLPHDPRGFKKRTFKELSSGISF